jgi:cytochrome b pre-mRNA-processing protein 3
MGMNDPALGRRVRKLVGALARRTNEWRHAIAGEADWSAVTLSSVYRSEETSKEAVAHSAESLRAIWGRLERASGADLGEGQF